MPELSSTTYSETDASNNSASPGGWPEGMSPSGVNDSDRGFAGAVKRFWDRIQGKYASTGSANAYVLTPDVALAAYVTGERYSFRSNFANTGSATLNISALGAVTLQKMTGSGKANLASGDIQNGQPVTVEYDGTDFIVTTLIASDASGGTVTSVGSGSGLSGGPITGSGSLALDVNGLAEDTNPDINADFVATYDVSGTANKKVLLNKLTSGKQTVWIPAAAMRATITNGCANLAVVETTAGRPDMAVLDFDTAADEHAQFSVAFPKSWDEGTVTFRAFWTTTNVSTNGVAWGLQGVAVSDNDTIDVDFGTPAVVTDDNQSAAEDLLVTAESGALTIAGTPAEGDTCFFDIFRDVSDANDDMTEDARLIGVQLFFTTNAGNDA